jgi:hypothetical protein
MSHLWIIVPIMMSAACIHHLAGSEIQAWRLRGRVVAMTEDLDVRHKSGQVVRISLDDRTEYI